MNNLAMSIVVACLTMPNPSTPSQWKEEYYEDWELSALRIAERIFHRQVKETECYKLAIIKTAGSVYFTYYDKKINAAELPEFKGRLPGSPSFSIEIATDGTIIHAGFSSGK